MTEKSILEIITCALQNNSDLEIVGESRVDYSLYPKRRLREQMVHIYIAPGGREITNVDDYRAFFNELDPKLETTFREPPASYRIPTNMGDRLPIGPHGTLCYDETIPQHEVEQLLRDKGIDLTNPELDPGYSLPEKYRRRILVFVFPTKELAELYSEVEGISGIDERIEQRRALDKLVREKIQ